MTEFFRITGLNLIDFDQGATGRYRLKHGEPPRGMSKILTRAEVLSILPKLPKGVRGHVLAKGLSRITFPFNIQGTSDADMEDAFHDFTETLEDGQLFIESEKAKGTQTVLYVKSDGAVGHSFKTIFYGVIDEADARRVLGDQIKEHYLINLGLTLYCEPRWRPDDATTLGPNEIFCPSFEEDGDANGIADDWTKFNTPTAYDTVQTVVLHGCWAQEIVTRAIAGDGIKSTVITAPAAETDAVCYAWICRTAGISDVIVQIFKEGAAEVAASRLDDGGWETRTAKDGVNVFHRVVVSTTGITPGNFSMRIWGEDAEATTYYVDKCFWKWGEVTPPEEWCDHWLIYNHYDTTEGAAHEGHINYFDVDDLKGDVDARLLMRVEFEKVADETYARHLIVGRRTRDPVCLDHWLEAEDRDGVSNWTTGALARCSAGNRVTDTPNTSGYVEWDVDAIAAYGTAASFGGRYDVYAAVKSEDYDNTWYRICYSLGAGYNIGKWVKQTVDAKWQLIKLGEVDFDPFTRSGVEPEYLLIRVEYDKQADDDAELDFIWLVHKDEPQMRLDCGTITDLPTGVSIQTLAVGMWWAVGRDEDFDYIGAELSTPPVEWDHWLHLRGEAMTLAPNKENRLYFVCITLDDPDDIYECHAIAGPANALEMIVNIDYLPQYNSPLE